MPGAGRKGRSFDAPRHRGSAGAGGEADDALPGPRAEGAESLDGGGEQRAVLTERVDGE
ncbi:MAG: hypothetical protein ACRELA_05675 [Candidatus Rokuibacteriota bacterium]